MLFNNHFVSRRDVVLNDLNNVGTAMSRDSGELRCGIVRSYQCARDAIDVDLCLTCIGELDVDAVVRGIA